MVASRSYIRDGAEIYRNSFAIIRAEADLQRFTGRAEKVAVRIIHASGMVEIAEEIGMSPDFAERAVVALQNGAPILCDTQMVAHGITRSRLPAANQVVCTIGDAAVPELARRLGTTRSAAAMELWRPHMAGAIVAIGNAQRSVFRTKLLPEISISIPCTLVQRLGQIPHPISPYSIWIKHPKTHGQNRRPRCAVFGAAGDHDFAQVNHVACCVAHSPQPFEKAGIFHRGSARQPRDLPCAARKRLAPEHFRITSDLIPSRPAKFVLHPFGSQRQIGRIDWSKAEVVERRDDPIVKAGILQRLPQKACTGRRESDVNGSGCHQ